MVSPSWLNPFLNFAIVSYSGFLDMQLWRPQKFLSGKQFTLHNQFQITKL